MLVVRVSGHDYFSSIRSIQLLFLFFFPFRPVSQAGRPVTGFIRPGTQSGLLTGSIEQAIKAPRTAATARYYYIVVVVVVSSITYWDIIIIIIA